MLVVVQFVHFGRGASERAEPLPLLALRTRGAASVPMFAGAHAQCLRALSTCDCYRAESAQSEHKVAHRQADMHASKH